MRHRKAGRKLKRTASHRKAMLSNLSTSLLRHKRVTTTLAKAKEARMLVDKLITKAKRANANENKAAGVHARRIVARIVNDRSVVKELFTEIAPKMAERKGGYTRVVKLGQRHGDASEVAVVELVDYNTGQAEKKQKPEKAEAKPAKKVGSKKKDVKKKKTIEETKTEDVSA